MLQLESVTKHFATKTILKEASAHLRPGSRVGLVGPNGIGKTTLLRLILGEQPLDGGRIRKRPRLRIGYLPQDLEEHLGNITPPPTTLDATHRGLYPEHEAKRILSGLGFSQEDFTRPLADLSGGFRMRVALAHMLLSAPDVLLLDEPTNHLDKTTQRWFEDFLLKSSFTMLVISHDTAFLDRIATHIWEIRHHRILESTGNYTKYLAWREAYDAAQKAAADRQDKEITRVQKFVDRFRYQATRARQVQSRIKQLEKVKRVERTRDPKRVRFRFPVPPASGRHVLELKGVAKAYGDNVVYRSLDFAVERGQRVALVGENGAGKSTLLKMLAGVLPPDAGARTVGHGVTLHYFAQHQADILSPEHTVLESIAEADDRADMNFIRAIAGAFLFEGANQKKLIKVLSGGERNRVALSRMLVKPANTLLLDEPTNHLDPASVDVLTDALVAFPGTMVFISHDPVFLTRVATRVVEIENGQARDYHGDYEYYLWKKVQELEPIKGAPEFESKPSKASSAPKAAPTAAPQSRVGNTSAFKERRELTKTLARIERQIAKLEGEIAAGEQRIQARDTELASEALYQDHERWTVLMKERENWVKDQSVLNSQWAELCEQAEQLRASLKSLESESR
jgi:ATP-binding cassette subfamily F protein 3